METATARTKVKIVYSRPPQINRHPKQREILDSTDRFVIVEASTKSGKTTGCIVWLFEQALRGRDGQNCWWVAPVSSQTKIAYKRLKRFLRASFFLFQDNKSDMTITLPNGVVIQFKSGDNPDSLYGDDVIAAVIDEATRCVEDVWTAIRSTLTFTKGKCRIIGNVKGTKNWAYALARRAQKGEIPGWKYIKITADDAVEVGVFTQEEVDDAKNTLPLSTFLELYYCIPNQRSSDRFCFSFDDTKHVKSCAINFNYPVYLSFDFNYNPICCTLIQYYDEIIRIPHMVKLENSNIYNLCDKLKVMMGNHLVIVTGDATGNSHTAYTKDNMNYYDIIKRELNLNRGQMQQPVINPTMEENQVLVNAAFEHRKWEIDPANAAGIIHDCQFVEMGPDGKIKKDNRKKEEQQADGLDTLRYWLNRFRNLIGL